MKILCVCEHGNVRSVALAYLLKTLFNQEAIAVGIRDVSDNTMAMLEKWSDYVVFVNKDVAYMSKVNLDREDVIVFNVGKDIWFTPKHEELVHKLYRELSKHPELWQK
jgi:hypothetical protein